MAALAYDDRTDRSVNFSPALFHAWYTSVISAGVSQEQSDEARGWWERIAARFAVMAANQSLFDPAWLDREQ